MSEPATKTNSIELGKFDGAIVIREGAHVELILPDIDQDAPMPDHLLPLMALAMIVGDNKKLQKAIDDMNDAIEEGLAKSNE